MTVAGRLSAMPGLPLKRPWGTRDGSADGVVGCEEVRDISLGPVELSKRELIPLARAPSAMRDARNRRAGRYLLNASRPAGFAVADEFTTSADQPSCASADRARRIRPGGDPKAGMLTGFGATGNKMCAILWGARYRTNSAAP